MGRRKTRCSGACSASRSSRVSQTGLESSIARSTATKSLLRTNGRASGFPLSASLAMNLRLMGVCTCQVWCETPRTRSGCTTIGSAKRQKCLRWRQKHRSLATAASLKATKTSGRPPTPRIGLIWRSTRMLLTVKALFCRFRSGRSRRWHRVGCYRLKQGPQKTSKAPQGSTTPLWAWVATNAPVKRS